MFQEKYFQTASKCSHRPEIAEKRLFNGKFNGNFIPYFFLIAYCFGSAPIGSPFFQFFFSF